MKRNIHTCAFDSKRIKTNNSNDNITIKPQLPIIEQRLYTEKEAHALIDQCLEIHRRNMESHFEELLNARMKEQYDYFSAFNQEYFYKTNTNCSYIS